MKVVDFGGGLGNQLADYFNYLAVRRGNPDETIYIDTLVYDIPEAYGTVSQWNGYEIEKVFGIQLPNIMDTFSANDQKRIIDDLRATQFWVNGWWPHRAIYETLNKHGFSFEVVGNIETNQESSSKQKITGAFRKYLTQQSANVVSYKLKQTVWRIASKVKKAPSGEMLYRRREGDVFYSPTFVGIKSPDLVEMVETELQDTLVFKPIDDDQNMRMMEVIQSSNSVSIHARRSDFLQYINDCYKYGYFKRAVSYIRKHVDNPVFVVFSEDCAWCKENREQIGLTDRDTVYFVDWNTGDRSSRDLQLMSSCKHNIITKSSFGYWACLLNKNPDKITCSQIGDYLTTNHF